MHCCIGMNCFFLALALLAAVLFPTKSLCLANVISPLSSQMWLVLFLLIARTHKLNLCYRCGLYETSVWIEAVRFICGKLDDL